MKWFRKQSVNSPSISDCTQSILYDEKTFYNKFWDDLSEAKNEVIIESPYITLPRLNNFKPLLEKLIQKKVKVFVVTRDPSEHDEFMAEQAEIGISYFEAIGVQVLLWEGGHHRKLAIIDRKILWEGSLNILSQRNSREFMRRIEDSKLPNEMYKFLKYDKVGIC